MTLEQLDTGLTAAVMSIAPGDHGDRLMEMGLIPGTQVRVIRRGAWRGPLQVSLRGAIICIDAHKAKTVSVNTLNTHDER